MTRYHIHNDGERLEISPSGRGRFVWALERFAIGTPLLFGAMAIFFLPDYLGRYAREQPAPGLFWLSLLMVAMLIASLLAVLRFLRHERWTFDAGARQIAYETRTFYGPMHGAEEALGNVTRVEMQGGRWPRTSTVTIELGEGVREMVCRVRGGADELVAIARALEEFFKRHRYRVEVVYSVGATRGTKRPAEEPVR